MSNPVDLTTTIELQPVLGAPAGTQDAAAEERSRLLVELAKTLAERDSYIKVVTHFMRKDYACPHTDEELLACVGTQPPMDVLIAELRHDLRSGI